MSLILRYAVRSDLGLVRGNNEDSVYAGPRLLAIADGMGGHAAGEVASKIVIGSLRYLDEDRHVDDLIAALRETVIEANQRIADAVAERSDLEGMGTTLTALRFSGSQVGLVHVGDSRAYLLRANTLSQITHDDTYVQFLVDSGKLTADEAKDHPRKSVILRALLGSDVEPDVSIREARAGDRYLLCTDGLSDVVSAETIFETLHIPDPQECADRLVELALRGGGPDNVTVIVADVVNARLDESADDVPVIAGAFIDPVAEDAPGEDSPAERAARISRSGGADGAPAAPVSRWRRMSWRTPLLIFSILALLVLALGGTYWWTQHQYFVGRDGTEVAIFRGVNTQFGPLKFFEVDENTDIAVSDLYPSARSQVIAGVTAHSKTEARQIVANLRTQRLPLCSTLKARSTASPTSTATSPPGGTTSAPASSPSKHPAGPSKHRGHSSPTTAGKHSGSARHSTAGAHSKSTATHARRTPSPTHSAPEPSSTAPSKPTIRPGVNCRSGP